MKQNSTNTIEIKQRLLENFSAKWNYLFLLAEDYPGVYLPLQGYM